MKKINEEIEQELVCRIKEYMSMIYSIDVDWSLDEYKDMLSRNILNIYYSEDDRLMAENYAKLYISKLKPEDILDAVYSFEENQTLTAFFIQLGKSKLPHIYILGSVVIEILDEITFFNLK